MSDPLAADGGRKEYSAGELGAIAHLYRGEIYRSTLWRQRLDTTTNWSVVTLGIALSVTYASAGASPLPLILVGILIFFFLMLEGRRYRYFNVFRARARWLEMHFYAPMLVEGDLHLEDGWQERLAGDYTKPRFHISLVRAVGRRLRRNYIWILAIQTVAYWGKIAVHPAPLVKVEQIWHRAAIGPIPGEYVVAAGMIYNLVWIGFALYTAYLDHRYWQEGRSTTSMR
ncbi:MAG: DUF2270 domain-containing protein [Rhodospirillales bacterium]